MQGSIPSIRGVHVESGPFAQGRNFRLFGDDSNGVPCRASIVFGRNGSGKTTLSREIAGIASGTSAGGYLYGADEKAVPLSEGERARIRVFNEDYVREKVLVEADGVESIVMLGEQADAKKKINEIGEELVELGKQFVEQRGVRDRLESGRESIANLEKAAKTAAKDGGWADRRAAIDGGRPSLTTARWDAILASETKEPRKALQDEFDQKLAELGRAEAAGSAIAGRVPVLDPSLFDEDGLVALLSKKLDEPVLTDRERRIMSLVQEGHQEIVETARDVFSRGETTVCPMCQRELTPEYRESLEESILRVLNDAVDAYRADLDRARIPEINEDAAALGDVPEELLVGYRKALAAANAIISSYERMVGERIGAIYAQVETAPLGLAGAIAALNAEAAAANEEIDSINASVRDRDALRERLLDLADQIAWLDAKDEIAALDSAKAELSAAKEKLDEIDGRRRKLNADLNRERTRMAMTNIAAETINSFLANVYFDTGRFVLVPKGNVYKIRSRGKPVRPQDVSAGERNVLALCYFFSESGRGRFEGSEDADPPVHRARRPHLQLRRGERDRNLLAHARALRGHPHGERGEQGHRHDAQPQRLPGDRAHPQRPERNAQDLPWRQDSLQGVTSDARRDRKLRDEQERVPEAPQERLRLRVLRDGGRGGVVRHRQRPQEDRRGLQHVQLRYQDGDARS